MVVVMLPRSISSWNLQLAATRVGVEAFSSIQTFAAVGPTVIRYATGAVRVAFTLECASTSTYPENLGRGVYSPRS